MKLVVAVLATILLIPFPGLSQDIDPNVDSSSAARRKKFDGLPLLSVDTDPFTPGIQRRLRVTDTSFTIDIVVSNLARPLSAYQFGLSFNPKVLRIVDPDKDVISGRFFGQSLILQKEITPSEVNWAEGVFFGGTGVSGDGILTTVMFEIIGRGSSRLALGQVVLAADGEDITGRVVSGAITAPRPRQSR